MPLRDGTGPQGGGARTGRGLGPCAPGPEDVAYNGENMGFLRRLGNRLRDGAVFGRRGQGRGSGRGRRRNR